MKNLICCFIISGLFYCHDVLAQIDTTLLRRAAPDTSRMQLNMDAVYNRPFLSFGKLPVALGGYVEANWQHLGTNGVSEGHQFQMRRLTLFVASTIYRRIKFLSEIEFEDGTKEINIEFASIDIEFHPLFNLRGGVVMNPIGAFNQNHDGPKWEFVDRPVSATQMLPATWSNVGFGLYGKLYRKDWVYAYEAYLTNGFDDKIISNGENKTFLPASKANPDRFEESFNGVPLITAKTAIRYKKVGELGISYMGGVYNKFKEDGLVFDKKRRLHVFAVDFNTTVPFTKTWINTEWAWVNVDIPETYSQQFGNKQRGGFVDFVQPVIKKDILGFERSMINAVFRVEYVDWNNGKFNETGTTIRDDFFSVVPGVSWRPTSQTVLRLNYRYNWQSDIFGNPAEKTAGFQFGFSSYF
ncbi:hypothetical protein [Chryseolinea sp. H1M3-3]|uniref:hypothetical protein n=1 Tax=Chryseolinea sp. H1M3-3 TaxID=3034144 RepID=UPI0023EDA390|nr:hypothetical protein [Chryseolinea sp. H1M3-3]